MSTRIEIIAKNLLHNFELLERFAPGKVQIPVLKSNAYGHGIEEVARVLHVKQPPYFLVQDYREAARLRAICDTPILLLGTPLVSEVVASNINNILLSVSSISFLRELSALNRPLSFHLCLNTGMNREGINESEIPEALKIIQSFPQMEYEGVWSHFADADNLDDHHRRQQEIAFSRILDTLQYAGNLPKWVHIGNSAGFTKTSDPRINAFRAGMANYGMDPIGTLRGIRPTLRIISSVVDIRQLNPGDSIGYNCSYVAPKPMIIGIVPVGYFEALDRRLSNVGSFSYIDHISQKRYCLPIRGKVSMNLTCFEISDAPIKIGDEIVIVSDHMGDKNSVQSISDTVDTIPDEILTRINPHLIRKVV